jgi:hypothetical protein
MVRRAKSGTSKREIASASGKAQTLLPGSHASFVRARGQRQGFVSVYTTLYIHGVRLLHQRLRSHLRELLAMFHDEIDCFS